ncbi:MAG: oxidative damage protection protein [Pyrinomonadaceae bacterium]
MSAEIKCKRCANKRPSLGYAPFPTELGQRVATEICQPCWAEWLAKQSMLINHYGLDLSTPDAQEFLFDNMQAFFFNAGQMTNIDTTKEGSIKW